MLKQDIFHVIRGAERYRYSQADPEWSSDPYVFADLPFQKPKYPGHTIGSVGCTMTAIAIAVSIKLNRRITPKQMNGSGLHLFRRIYKVNIMMLHGGVFKSAGKTIQLQFEPIANPSDIIKPRKIIGDSGTNILNRIKEQILMDRPVIIGFDTTDAWVRHSVTAYGFMNGQILVNDPNGGRNIYLGEAMKKSKGQLDFAVAMLR